MEEKRTVLIVDDDTDILSQLGWALAETHSVRTAGDPFEGIRQIALDAPPAFALIDLHLPPDAATIEGGLYLIRLIHGACPSTRIIAISSDDGGGVRDRVLAAGAVTLLNKPVEIRRLLKWLAESTGEEVPL